MCPCFGMAGGRNCILAAYGEARKAFCGVRRRQLSILLLTATVRLFKWYSKHEAVSLQLDEAGGAAAKHLVNTL